MVALYALVHFHCTISVIQLYRGTDFISFLSCVSMKVYINHVFNDLVKKMMNDLGSIFFFPNIIIRESIRISMWELNKVYDMGV